MRKGISWLSVDADLAGNPKVLYLSDNNARWTWICLLGLEKQGRLEGEDVRMFAKYCDIEQSRFDDILCELQNLKLTDKYNRPIGFDQWQACVQKRERDVRYANRRTTDGQPTVNRRTTDGESTLADGQPTVNRLSDTHTETDIRKKPPKPPLPGATRKRAGLVKAELKSQAKEILDHLVAVTGRPFSKADNIEKCIKREGCSVDDCKTVIDFKWSEWKGGPVEKNVDTVTLWRPSRFSDYLDQARAVKPAEAIDNRPRDDWGNVIPEWKLKMIRENEEWAKTREENQNA